MAGLFIFLFIFSTEAKEATTTIQNPRYNIFNIPFHISLIA